LVLRCRRNTHATPPRPHVARSYIASVLEGVEEQMDARKSRAAGRFTTPSQAAETHACASAAAVACGK